MNSEFLSIIGNVVGAMIITYYVSRGYLMLLKGRLPTSTRVPVAHLASWFSITLFVFWLEGYSAGAGWVYIGPQVLWFVLDRFQLQGARA